MSIDEADCFRAFILFAAVDSGLGPPPDCFYNKLIISRGECSVSAHKCQVCWDSTDHTDAQPTHRAPTPTNAH